MFKNGSNTPLSPQHVDPFAPASLPSSPFASKIKFAAPVSALPAFEDSPIISRSPARSPSRNNVTLDQQLVFATNQAKATPAPTPTTTPKPTSGAFGGGGFGSNQAKATPAPTPTPTPKPTSGALGGGGFGGGGFGSNQAKATPAPTPTPTPKPTSGGLDSNRGTTSLGVLDGTFAVTSMALENAIAHDEELIGSVNILQVALRAVKHATSVPKLPFGITINEAGSIHAYTQESALYRIVGKRLRSPVQHKVEPLFPYLKLVFGALAKLPRVNVFTTVYRGIKADLHCEYSKGTKFHWWSMTSTTTHLDVLQQPAFLGKTGKRTMFAIEAVDLVSIKEFSAFPNEVEYMLLPGTYMEVISAPLDTGNDLWLVQVRQIRPLQQAVDALPVHPHFTTAPQ